MKKLDRKMMVLLLLVVISSVAFAADSSAEAGSKFITILRPIIEYGLKITGGFIGLFGGVQFAMAYLQSNPTAYAEAGKKIVAGGMLVGIGIIVPSFLTV